MFLNLMLKNILMVYPKKAHSQIILDKANPTDRVWTSIEIQMKLVFISLCPNHQGQNSKNFLRSSYDQNYTQITLSVKSLMKT